MEFDTLLPRSSRAGVDQPMTWATDIEFAPITDWIRPDY